VKLAFVIRPVASLDLLHQREPEALGGATLDLALDACGLIALPTSWRRADPMTTRVSPSSTSTLGDDAHRGEQPARRASAPGGLAGLGSSGQVRGGW
jgi:hypothetical protein